MAAFATIFDIVMDRVIVGRDRLERREIGLGDSAARDVKPLSEREVLEIPALRKAVLPPIKFLGHLSLQGSEQSGQIPGSMEDPHNNRRTAIYGVSNQIRVPGQHDKSISSACR